MTKNAWMNNEEALERADAFYAFVGRYVVFFQSLEFKFDEMFLLGCKGDDYTKKQAWLARQGTKEKITKLKDLVLQKSVFPTKKLNGWNEHFEKVVERVHAERQRRNDILHSTYLFDFLDIKGPIVRTKLRRAPINAGGVLVESEPIPDEQWDQILIELAQLCFDFGVCCSQLRSSFIEVNDI